VVNKPSVVLSSAMISALTASLGYPLA
jgi:hypothetical protein